MNCFVNGQTVPCNVFFAQFGWVFILLFGVLGLLFALMPKRVLQVKIWSQKTFMAAKYIPSTKTESIVRAMGALFIAIAAVFVYLTFAP